MVMAKVHHAVYDNEIAIAEPAKISPNIKP
jgi:hypothetical protein